MAIRQCPPTGNDPNEQLYSDAYDKATRGEPKPDTSFVTDLQRHVINLGYSQGQRNQAICDKAHKYDPSGDYLTRMYHEKHKWEFEVA